MGKTGIFEKEAGVGKFMVSASLNSGVTFFNKNEERLKSYLILVLS